jgi:hypothetical protein
MVPRNEPGEPAMSVTEKASTAGKITIIFESTRMLLSMQKPLAAQPLRMLLVTENFLSAA